MNRKLIIGVSAALVVGLVTYVLIKKMKRGKTGSPKTPMQSLMSDEVKAMKLESILKNPRIEEGVGA